jgi:hypothetical protein
VVERWLDLAACLGTPLDWWYWRDSEAEDEGPPMDTRERARWSEHRRARAERLCRSCPVQQECFEDVMRLEVNPRGSPKSKENRHGYRAGLTPSERALLA